MHFLDEVKKVLEKKYSTEFINSLELKEISISNRDLGSYENFELTISLEIDGESDSPRSYSSKKIKSNE